MPSYAMQKNIGAYIKPRAFDGEILSETTTETHSTAASRFYDRYKLSEDSFSTSTGTAASATDPLYQSCKVVFVVHADIPAGETVTISGNLQDATSSTGADVADHGSSTQSATIGSTSSTAAQDITGQLAFDVDLTEANRYLRTQCSLAFSSTSTSGDNVANVIPLLIFGGGEFLPPV